jgi:hypothetical protein
MPIPDEEIEEMRARDFARALEQPCPAWLECERCEGSNSIIITNTRTGQIAHVWLFSLKMIREVLNDLFGDEPPVEPPAPQDHPETRP